MSYEVSNFQEEVVEASHSKPVVVDFWAPWCGPCRQLSPTLEEMAEAQADQWILVKVNTDENGSIAQRYGIRGIPAVKLFVDGEVVDEFTGALPRHAIQRWLDDALPSESKKRIEQARDALKRQAFNEAQEHLEAVLSAEPDNDEAKVLLARTVLFTDPEKARSLVNDANVAAPEHLQTKEAVRTLTRLLKPMGADEELPEDNGRVAYEKALDALREENVDAALEHFIEVINQNRYYDDDGARKACVALFTVLGNEHPAVKKHRRTFDMALY